MMLITGVSPNPCALGGGGLGMWAGYVGRVCEPGM